MYLNSIKRIWKKKNNEQSWQDNNEASQIGKIVRRNTFLLLGNAAIFLCIFQVILTLSGIVILDYTGSVSLASLAVAIVLGCDILVVYHSGKLMDKIGRKKVLILGVAVGCISLLLMAIALLTSQIALFWVGLFTFSLSSGIISQNKTAMTDMYPTHFHGQCIGYLNTAIGIGLISAPILIALLEPISVNVGINNYFLIITVSILLLIVGGLLIKLMKPDTIEIAAHIEKFTLEKNSEDKSHDKPLAKLTIIFAFITSALAYAVLSIILSTVPLIFRQNGIELALISIPIAIIGFGSHLLSTPIGWLSDRFKKSLLIMAGGLVMGAGAFSLTLTNTYSVACFSALFVGIGGSSIIVASTALISEAAHFEKRGQIFGANNLTINVATLILPIFGGLVLSYIGTFALAVLVVITSFTICLTATLIKK